MNPTRLIAGCALAVAAIACSANPPDTSASLPGVPAAEPISDPTRLLREVRPEYPLAAFTQGIEGESRIRFVIQPGKIPGDFAIEHSSGNPELDRAALQAVRQIKGDHVAGLAEKQVVVVPVRFSLAEARYRHLGRTPNADLLAGLVTLEMRIVATEAVYMNRVARLYQKWSASDLSEMPELISAQLRELDAIAEDLAPTRQFAAAGLESIAQRLRDAVQPPRVGDVVTQAVEEMLRKDYLHVSRFDESQRKIVTRYRAVLEHFLRNLKSLRYDGEKLVSTDESVSRADHALRASLTDVLIEFVKHQREFANDSLRMLTAVNAYVLVYWLEANVLTPVFPQRVTGK